MKKSASHPASEFSVILCASSVLSVFLTISMALLLDACSSAPGPARTSIVSRVNAMPVSAGMKGLAIHGERYEAEVPDTLDLAERAQLAWEPLMKWAEDRKLYPEG